MNICVMGTSISSQNRGVLALGASLVGLCARVIPDAGIKLLLGHHKPDTFWVKVGTQARAIPVVNSRLSLRSNLQEHLVWILMLSIVFRLVPLLRPRIVRSNRWIHTIVEADIIGDVRGGDSFSDLYGFRQFLRGFIEAWTVLLVKGHIVQFPQTYGPYQHTVTGWLARYLLKKSSTVLARDKESQQVAQKLIGKNKNVLLSPDVAFSLEPMQPNELILDPPVDSYDRWRTVGLNVNGLMFNGGYTRNNMFGLKLEYQSFLRSLAAAILNTTDAELWLIPHTLGADDDIESDTAASFSVRNSLPEHMRCRVRIVTAPYDQHELKAVIGMCDFFIGSRMHSCIAALSQGIPCVAVAYSMKFAGVFDSMGMRDWVVDGRECTDGEAVARVLGLYRARNDVRSGLIQRATAARAELYEVFHRLLISRKGRTQ